MNLNTRVIDPLLHDLSIVLVIVMPALTMRVFAEEKRTGTYELLLTAPVRTGEIVAGKFLAAAAFTLIMVALAWIFPLILIIFGDPEVGVMFAGYLGLALLALSFVAVGLFTSSLTQNQIIAAISSFGLLILLYVISWPAEAGGGIVCVGAQLSLAAGSFLDHDARRDRYHRHRVFPERDPGGAVPDAAIGRIGTLALGGGRRMKRSSALSGLIGSSFFCSASLGYVLTSGRLRAPVCRRVNLLAA